MILIKDKLLKIAPVLFFALALVISFGTFVGVADAQWQLEEDDYCLANPAVCDPPSCPGGTSHGDECTTVGATCTVTTGGFQPYGYLYRCAGTGPSTPAPPGFCRLGPVESVLEATQADCQATIASSNYCGAGVVTDDLVPLSLVTSHAALGGNHCLSSFYDPLCTGAGVSSRVIYYYPAQNCTPANNPPSTPSVSGPNTGTTNAATTNFTFSGANDPDGNQVRYDVDWGDGNNQWLPSSGYVNSGTNRTANHTYTSDGTYQVRVRAQDDKGEFSGWSSNHQIVISDPVVPPAITVTPTTLDFVDVEVGDTPTLNFVVRNTGGGTLTVNPPTISGAFADRYDCAAGGCGSIQNIPGGGSMTYTVSYSPNAVSNGQTATLNFTGTFSRNVSLTGNGTNPSGAGACNIQGANRITGGSGKSLLPLGGLSWQYEFNWINQPNFAILKNRCDAECNSAAGNYCEMEINWTNDGINRTEGSSECYEYTSGTVSAEPIVSGSAFYADSCVAAPPGPSVEFDPPLNPPAIVEGDTHTMYWTSNHATTCELRDITNNVYTTVGINSSYTTPSSLTTDTQYRIHCRNGSGPWSSWSSVLTVLITPAPTAQIGVSVDGGLVQYAGPVSVDDTSTLSVVWAGAHTGSCTETGGTNFSTGGALSGTDSTVATPAAGASDTFSVNCGGAPASITVQTNTYCWQETSSSFVATDGECTAMGPRSGMSSPAASACDEVSELGNTYNQGCSGGGPGFYPNFTCVNTCTPPGATANLQVSVEGGPWQDVNLTGANAIDPGQNIELQWASANAGSCTSINGNFNTGGATSNSGLAVTEPAPGATLTYGIDCGGAPDEIAVEVNPAPNLQIFFDPNPTLMPETDDGTPSGNVTGNYTSVTFDFTVQEMNGIAVPDSFDVLLELDVEGNGTVDDSITINVGGIAASDAVPYTRTFNFNLPTVPASRIVASVDAPTTTNGVIIETNEGDNVDILSPVPSGLPPFTMSLELDPSDLVRGGGDVEIDYDVNAVFDMDCSITGPQLRPNNPHTFNPSIPAEGPSGTLTAGPITAKSVYVLECTERVTGNDEVFTETASVETTGEVEEI